MRIAISSGFETKNVNGFGLQISNKYGHISVISNSPYSPAKHSITDFVVEEQHRGKGFGKDLLKEAIRRFGEDLGGQASSKESVTMMYGLGFRMANDTDGSLQDALQAMREDSSVYMRFKK